MKIRTALLKKNRIQDAASLAVKLEKAVLKGEMHNRALLIKDILALVQSDTVTDIPENEWKAVTDLLCSGITGFRAGYIIDAETAVRAIPLIKSTNYNGYKKIFAAAAEKGTCILQMPLNDEEAEDVQ
jgi:hypothetical protein